LLTPKSILLACQIKDLTNNSELITTANKLGHGVSYSVLHELLTEVAYAKTENPDMCNKETFTILVEDNIDRLEETLSGKLKFLWFIFPYSKISNTLHLRKPV